MEIVDYSSDVQTYAEVNKNNLLISDELDINMCTC